MNAPATLAQDTELVGLDGLAELVVTHDRHGGWMAGELRVAERLELRRRRRVVAVDVDDHRGPPFALAAHRSCST